jgi:hypothetical protein
MMCVMSDQRRGKAREARVTGDRDDGKPGRWWLAWFAFCAVLGLGVLGVLAWAVIKVVTRYAG